MIELKQNPCVLLYNAVANNQIFGTVEGICRITGKQSKGLPFKKWVKDTFTNHGELYEGAIVSNEALFCFVEDSKQIQAITGRDKLQRFRTYSHILDKNNVWHICTKADKLKIIELLKDSPKIVCLTDSGQKHVFFKNKVGMWQLDGVHVMPNIQEFDRLHTAMMDLVKEGFTQSEIITGNYHNNNILKVGIKKWQGMESKIKDMRGEPFFDFVAWLMYAVKKD